MSGKKVWFCANCGYEVNNRGRCFRCRERLVASPLPELAELGEDEEVAYRLEDWDEAGRARLIVALIRANVRHRFDQDELVVAAGDEARVDDLLEELAVILAAEAAEAAGGEGGEDAGEGKDPGAGVPAVLAAGEDAGDTSAGTAAAGEPAGEGAAAERGLVFDPGQPPPVASAAQREALRLLYQAARRLEEDATDMQADGDVAEASALVFSVDSYPEMADTAWAALGRHTRHLLAALGAEEALEDEIRAHAASVARLLAPQFQPGSVHDGAGDEIAYELPQWSETQRQDLVKRLEEEGIGYAWDGGDLIVAAEREEEVDAIFEAVSGMPAPDDDDGGEGRYRALEELFAAADRLTHDPGSEARRADVVAAALAADGGTPFGMADVEWWQVRARVRGLAEAIAQGAASTRVHDDAVAVRDLLRTIV
jgi:hypothetical protein